MASFPYMGFVDETGVLQYEPTQPFFAIGLLLVEDTSRLYQELQAVRMRAVAQTNTKGKRFEFKFNHITKRNYAFYQEVIDVLLSYSDIRICVFVLDKTAATASPPEHIPSTWDAYISYLKTAVRDNVEEDRKCVIIADYITKPMSSPKFLESEVRSLPQVLNATVLESHASLFIQVVDILLGCVVYEYKHAKDPSLPVNRSKKGVSDYLMDKLGRTTLAAEFTLTEPVFFAVREFRP